MAKHKKRMAKKNTRAKTSSYKGLKRKAPLNSRLLLLFVIIFAAVGSYAVYRSLAAKPVASSGMKAVETQHMVNRGGADLDPTCIDEDDELVISATGSIQPGESFQYTANTEDCRYNQRAIVMKLSWTSQQRKNPAKLELSSVTHGSDYSSWSPPTSGTTINTTRTVSPSALCMFTWDINGENYNTSFNIKNVSSVTAYNVSFVLLDRNDWPDYYYQECQIQDADADGWSDSFEHYMAQVTRGNVSYGEAGMDYLKRCGTPTPNDEFDYWPPDMNDDNKVTQADIDFLATYLGQGDGKTAFSINTYPFSRASALWRRYDVNLDGLVNDADTLILKTHLGESCSA